MLVVGEIVVLGRDSSVLDEPSERAAPNEAFVLTGSVDVLGSSRSFADCADRAVFVARGASALSMELGPSLRISRNKPVRANRATAAVEASATTRPLAVALLAALNPAVFAIGSGAGNPSALHSNASDASAARALPMDSSSWSRNTSGATAKGMAEKSMLGLVIALRRSSQTAHLSR